jgi:hypothetical protein
MAAPFPEIMDTPSYTFHLNSLAMPSLGRELFGFFVDCLFLALHITRLGYFCYEYNICCPSYKSSAGMDDESYII